MKKSLSLVSLVFFLAGWSCADTEIGKKVSTLKELEAMQEKLGYNLQGSFGDSWPCTVTGIEKGLGSLSFELKDHGSQGYPGYDGRELKLVRLNCADGKESGYVFIK